MKTPTIRLPADNITFDVEENTEHQFKIYRNSEEWL